jgi:hypothetical protein
MIVPTPMGSRWPRSVKPEPTADRNAINIVGLSHFMGLTVPLHAAESYAGICRDGLNTDEASGRQQTPATASESRKPPLG